MKTPPIAPLGVNCPICRASVGSSCMEERMAPSGYRYNDPINYYHGPRVDMAFVVLQEKLLATPDFDDEEKTTELVR